jgi:O-antigen/teichoic acid export membrane protein
MCIFTGMLASTATALILLIGILCAIAGWLLMPRLLFAPLIRIGAPVCLSGLPHGSNLRLDQLLMAGLVPAATLGLYAVAVTWSGVMISVTSKIL